MTSSAIASQHALLSATQESINTSKLALRDSPHPEYLHHLATTILRNLQYQHSWTSLTIHTHSPLNAAPFPRPMISGLPPRRAYIHPDEQAAIIKAEHDSGEKIEQKPEREWVLPSHIKEKWTLKSFASIFDTTSVVPPGDLGRGEEDEEGSEAKPVGDEWQGENRQKRLLLATLDGDSTVTYYIMHDGIVKPRQN